MKFFMIVIMLFFASGAYAESNILLNYSQSLPNNFEVSNQSFGGSVEWRLVTQLLSFETGVLYTTLHYHPLNLIGNCITGEPEGRFMNRIELKGLGFPLHVNITPLAQHSISPLFSFGYRGHLPFSAYYLNDENQHMFSENLSYAGRGFAELRAGVRVKVADEFAVKLLTTYHNDPQDNKDWYFMPRNTHFTFTGQAVFSLKRSSN